MLVWLVRFIYAILGLALAALLWELLHGAVWPWQPNEGFLWPRGGQWLELIALISAYAGGTQIFLFFFAVPTPRLRLYNNGRLWRLKQEETDDQRDLERAPREGDSNDSYAIMHLQVESPFRHRVFEALHQRRAVFGAQIWFRYEDLESHAPSNTEEQKWLLGRWDANPEPVDTFIKPDGSEAARLSRQFLVFNRQLAALYPTGKEGNRQPYTVSFLTMRWGDSNLYHFNDESYMYQSSHARWCRPEWALKGKRYRVQIRLTGQGLASPVEQVFMLENPTGTFKGVTFVKEG